MARYHILPDRSRVWIDARSNVHPIHSETDRLEGWLELELGGGGWLDVEVDLGAEPDGQLSVRVDELRSGNPLEDSELKRRADVRRFPTIDGRLRAMTAVDGGGRYRVRGDLTFRGVTRSCEDEMRVERLDERTVRLRGRSTFDVRDFGMEPPRILVFRVEPEVAVRVEIVAEREG